MSDSLSDLFAALFFGYNGEPLGGVDFSALPQDEGAVGIRRFAERLCAPDKTSQDAPNRFEPFLIHGANLIVEELTALRRHEEGFEQSVEEAAARIKERGSQWEDEIRRAVWRVFFPEAARLEEDRTAAIESLRKFRMVKELELNDRPITDPAGEILFTSNVLLTTPASEAELQGLDLPTQLIDRIRRVMGEPQRFFYDHPIHIGVDTEANEAIYGLRGLDEALEFEKERGNLAPGQRATLLLSLSVTHDGLHSVAREYLEAELKKVPPFANIEVYLFSEIEAQSLVTEVLEPYLDGHEQARALLEVFGVDGEYGRHYSFLKALPALWSVFRDPRVRGTFKIDLDQVFPQKELVQESGRSALEHFTTPLWGARGVDSEGESVELGMIAGALVNEKDISNGLFTPDVPIPETIPRGEAAIFFNKLPMALSTRGEMMTRYLPTTQLGLDGERRCIHRFHVTGGTNGVLIDALRRHRPFTPSFIGRAEDQAYILSVLYDRDAAPSGLLRYLHEPGLIMRHDKEAFAGASIAAAEQGRFVGDLVRTLLFTEYAEVLPWGFDHIKRQIDPFTGCFVTRRRLSIVFLRLVLKAATLFREKRGREAEELLLLAERKLSSHLPGAAGRFGVASAYRKERAAWHAYYDALDRAQEKSRASGAARPQAPEPDTPAKPPQGASALEQILQKARLV